MDGVLLIDKPAGITSAGAVERIRKKLRTKAGHTGTLDPIATGLLVILTGKATRFSWIFQELSKGYYTRGILGVVTDTYDVEGTVLENREVRVSCEDLEEIVRSFRGEIIQNPPPFSAKKVSGKRAYKLARKGVSPPLKPVKVTVHEIRLERCTIPSFEVFALVSSGTYMRTLIHDIGLKARTGAVVESLRRLSVGPFRVEEAISLDKFMDADDPSPFIIPVDRALSFLPEVSLNSFQGDRIMKGTSLLIPDRQEEGNVRIYINSKFVGVGHLRSGVLKPKRLIPFKNS